MSTNWITIQPSDVYDFMVGPQLDALRSASLGTGQTDPLPTIISEISLRIRNEIRGCKSNVISLTAGSIPPDLKSTALTLIAVQLQRRIPQLPLTDDQKDAEKQALDYLRRVSLCQIPITVPLDPLVPDDAQRAAPAQVLNSNTRITSRSTTRGL